MRISTSAVLLALASPLAAFCTAAQADTVFTDSSFNLSDYTQIGPYLDFGSPSTTGSMTASQCTSCGNPGDALQITSSVTTAAGFAGDMVLLNTGFTYDPQTQGALGSISVSTEKQVSSPNFGFTVTPSFWPVIEQDGILYAATIPGTPIALPSPGASPWQTLSASGLTAADFTNIDLSTWTLSGTASPNFDGDPLTFGLAQLTEFSGASGSFISTYDNLSFDLTIPEPSTAGLAVLGLAGLGAVRWSRRRMAI